MPTVLISPCTVTRTVQVPTGRLFDNLKIIWDEWEVRCGSDVFSGYVVILVGTNLDKSVSTVYSYL